MHISPDRTPNPPAGLAHMLRRAGVPALALLGMLAAARVDPAAPGEAELAAALRQRLGQMRTDGPAEIHGIALGSAELLADFYESRAYRPVWPGASRADELLELLGTAPAHGLDPADYFPERLRALIDAEPRDPGLLAERDLLLTEALVRYGYQRRFGKVDPATQEPAWNFARGFARGSDPVTALTRLVEAPSFADFMAAALDEGPFYRGLQASLARYREYDSAGGWPTVPQGPSLRPGERSDRVVAVRERLAAEGAPVTAADPAAFDDALAMAVRTFQERHGLAADGVVGARTLAALNVPASARVDQLRMSLERIRWLAGGIPETYVVVNVAGFTVGSVRDRQPLWSSRVVVGRAARQTPVFRGEMTYIEINPTWTVPPTILREDMLPKIKRDPGYLERENISVIDRAGRLVDPWSVDWSAYSRGVPYTLRQSPGPANALGRIKLMFPNPHAVYLHDTPSKGLFARAERTFSSGCIRVEDPLALAELVLDSPEWTRAALEAAIENGSTRRVNLRRPVPVLLVYLTAVADTDGVTRFYRDVYGRDPALLQALQGPVQINLPATFATAADRRQGRKLGPASL